MPCWDRTVSLTLPSGFRRHQRDLLAPEVDLNSEIGHLAALTDLARPRASLSSLLRHCQ